jgi:cation:H+ antiporter
VSALLLLGSAKYVVKYAHLIAVEVGLSDFVIGLLIVAIGTTLPETTVNTVSVLRRHYGIAIGNSVGSVSANLTLVVGLAALIHPIKNNFAAIFGSGAFMIIAVYMFYLLIKDRIELKRAHGFALVFIYLVFLIFQYLLNSAKV